MYFCAEDVIPTSSKESDDKEIGKDKQIELIDTSKDEKEKTPDKIIKEVPTEEKTEQNVETGKGKELEKDKWKDLGKDSGKVKPTVGSSDKFSSKDLEESTVAKKDSDNGKLVHYIDKDVGLDSEKNGEIDQTNELDTNIVNIVLIDDKFHIKKITPYLHTPTEKYIEQTTTDVPQFTIISLRNDEKVNVPYKIDTSLPGSTSTPVDSNDIERGVGTLRPKETPKILPTASERNGTDKDVVLTLQPETGTTVEPQKTTEKQTKTVSQHTEQAIENLSTMGNPNCLCIPSSPCPPIHPSIYNIG